jgi:hypothetical protein
MEGDKTDDKSKERDYRTQWICDMSLFSGSYYEGRRFISLGFYVLFTYVNTFIYSLIDHMFTECLLYPRCWSRHREYTAMSKKVSILIRGDR